MDKKTLDKIYKLYGFATEEPVNDEVRAYLYREGYFTNIDLVPLTNDADVEQVKAYYEEAGFSVSIRRFSDVKEVEESLFNGFFSINATRKRINKEYERFTDNLTETLGSRYEYVSAPYSVNGGEKRSVDEIVEDLVGALSGPGPKLVLLEAAAGYGKTCTAYEVTKRIGDYNEDKIPFLVELSRNRSAKICLF